LRKVRHALSIRVLRRARFGRSAGQGRSLPARSPSLLRSAGPDAGRGDAL